MNTKIRSSLLLRLLLPTLAVCAVLLSAPLVTRAQQASGTLTPIVECATIDNNGNLTAYLGYRNDHNDAVFIRAGTSRNYMTPGAINRNQPSVFQIGEHRVNFTIRFIPTDEVPTIEWVLDGKRVAINAAAPRCRSGRITYQGRLSANGAAASGSYDLQFQIFDKATNGTAASPLVSVPNVTPANGVFTVPLDFGISALNTNGERFLEIGVSPAGAGAYTTLAPRQPLTEAPSAVFAQNALNASMLDGVRADNFAQSGQVIRNSSTEQFGDFNISGSGRIGGTLAASAATVNTLTANNATINDTLTTSKAAINGGVLARGGAPGANGSNNNGYAFNGTGDNDSGLFSEANGQVSLYTNSVERVRVTDNGLQVFGTLTANTKNFRIDHPLDPANKVLNYTSVESPDMMNIYNGNTTTDHKGEAVVTMPAYFESLNRDFRYQLTVIGSFAQAIVAEEIAGNSFKIRTDKPNVKVSWQVTGIRHDKFAEDQRQPVEADKPAGERGKCLYDPACRTTPNTAAPTGKP